MLGLRYVFFDPVNGTIVDTGDATVNGSNLSVTLPGSLTGNLEPGLYQMFVAVFSEEIASLSERQIDIEILG